MKFLIPKTTPFLRSSLYKTGVLEVPLVDGFLYDFMTAFLLSHPLSSPRVSLERLGDSTFFQASENPRGNGKPPVLKLRGIQTAQ